MAAGTDESIWASNEQFQTWEDHGDAAYYTGYMTYAAAHRFAVHRRTDADYERMVDLLRSPAAELESSRSVPGYMYPVGRTRCSQKVTPVPHGHPEYNLHVATSTARQPRELPADPTTSKARSAARIYYEGEPRPTARTAGSSRPPRPGRRAHRPSTPSAAPSSASSYAYDLLDDDRRPGRRWRTRSPSRRRVPPASGTRSSASGTCPETPSCSSQSLLQLFLGVGHVHDSGRRGTRPHSARTRSTAYVLEATSAATAWTTPDYEAWDCPDGLPWEVDPAYDFDATDTSDFVRRPARSRLPVRRAWATQAHRLRLLHQPACGRRGVHAPPGGAGLARHRATAAVPRVHRSPSSSRRATPRRRAPDARQRSDMPDFCDSWIGTDLLHPIVLQPIQQRLQSTGTGRRALRALEAADAGGLPLRRAREQRSVLVPAHLRTVRRRRPLDPSAGCGHSGRRGGRTSPGLLCPSRTSRSIPSAPPTGTGLDSGLALGRSAHRSHRRGATAICEEGFTALGV